MAYDNNESKKDNEGYLNTLTTELLNHQRSSALEAENESLKKKVSMLARRRPRANEVVDQWGGMFFVVETHYMNPKTINLTVVPSNLMDIATIVES